MPELRTGRTAPAVDFAIRSVRPIDCLPLGLPDPPLWRFWVGAVLVGSLPGLCAYEPAAAVIMSGGVLLFLCSGGSTRLPPLLASSLLVTAMVAIWAVLQLLPLVPQAWTHTIWILAANAGETWRPRISIDPALGWPALAALLAVAGALVAGWALSARGGAADRLLLVPLALGVLAAPLILLVSHWSMAGLLVVAAAAATEWLYPRGAGPTRVPPRALAILALPGLMVLALHDAAAIAPPLLVTALIVVFRIWPAGRGGAGPASVLLLLILALGGVAGWVTMPDGSGPMEAVALAWSGLAMTPWQGLGLGAADAALPMLRAALPGPSLPPPAPLPSPLALLLGLGIPAALALLLAALLALLPAARAVIRRDVTSGGVARVVLASAAGLLMLALMRPGDDEAGAVLLLATLVGAAGLPPTRHHGKPRTP